MDSAGAYVVSTQKTIGFGTFEPAFVVVGLLEPPPPPPQAARVETSAPTVTGGRRRFTGCPPIVETERAGRLYRPSAEAVSDWKWPISCSLRLMRTPCSSAPE